MNYKPEETETNQVKIVIFLLILANSDNPEELLFFPTLCLTVSLIFILDILYDSFYPC